MFLDTWIIMLALLKTLRKEMLPGSDLKIVWKHRSNVLRNIDELFAIFKSLEDN